MNNWDEWVFNGIGTSILTGVVGLILGGIFGYKIGVNITVKKTTMIQKTNGDGTHSTQVGEINVK